jgi:hypothetical protein
VRSAATEATFVRSGDVRLVDFAGRRVTVRELTGYRYLERLLRSPGREVHVLDLVGSPLDEGGLPVLDDEARAAYRRRLIEVEQDLDEAVQQHDLARQQLAERDREYLLAELGRAVGLGGRRRATGATAERARTSVARSLRYALDRLGEHHPLLAGHLSAAVRTGTWCSYRPDPTAPVRWRLDRDVSRG